MALARCTTGASLPSDPEGLCSESGDCHVPVFRAHDDGFARFVVAARALGHEPPQWRADEQCAFSTPEAGQEAPWNPTPVCEFVESCSRWEFSCGGGVCIPQSWQCDDEVDCLSGADEESCQDV